MLKITIFLFFSLFINISYAKSNSIKSYEELEDNTIIESISEDGFIEEDSFTINSDVDYNINYNQFIISLKKHELIDKYYSYKNINQNVFDNNSIYHIANMRNDKQLLDISIKNKANPKNINNSKQNPLLLACQFGNIDIIKTNLNYLKNIYKNNSDKIDSILLQKDNFRRNCFHYAALNYNKDIFIFLIENISNFDLYIKSEDKQGNTPIHILIHSNNIKSVIYLSNLNKNLIYSEDYIELMNQKLSLEQKLEIQKLTKIKIKNNYFEK